MNPAAIYELYQNALGTSASTPVELEAQQSNLNVVREVFSNKKFPSMIAALKQTIVIYADDPAWRTVRPPLVELTPEQANLLAVELKAIEFTMPGL